MHEAEMLSVQLLHDSGPQVNKLSKEHSDPFRILFQKDQQTDYPTKRHTTDGQEGS